jgi:hypothetical protein
VLIGVECDDGCDYIREVDASVELRSGTGQEHALLSSSISQRIPTPVRLGYVIEYTSWPTTDNFLKIRATFADRLGLSRASVEIEVVRPLDFCKILKC